MTTASGEKVLVWQSIIRGRCINASPQPGGVSTLVNPATGGAAARCSSNGMGSRSGGGAVRGIGVAALRRLSYAYRMSPASRLQIHLCLLTLLARAGIGIDLRWQERSVRTPPFSPRAATDPIHEILDTPPENVAYP
jgi:hypothetical protein